MLFVYGTLQKNSSSHDLLGRSKYLGNASVMATLYDTGAGFPAAVEEGTRNKTWGEVYEVTDDLLDALDEYEGCYPDNEEESLYIRKEMEAQFQDRKTVTAQVYIMPEEQLKKFFAFEISDGRWRG
jgi:gamma-glutamylcyclotransferase (GGCT)/AIG2-like uncharacterized protein YtfP